tara:strand:- start:4 stop:507 length:504 start_codon:yes stop_codon:yes gene_type:complete
MKYLFVFLLLGLVSCGDASSNASENVKPKLKEYSWDEVTMPNDTIAFFKKDMKPVTGIVRGWYEDGQLWTEQNYKDGKKDGSDRWWYENGQLNNEYNYKDDKKDGLFRSWYENGQLMFDYNYKDGKNDGLCSWWYESGQLMFDYNYKDGKLISEKCFDENGNKIICE